MLYLFLFLFSLCLLSWASSLLVGALNRIAQFLEWKEFVVSFIIISIAGSIPNLFVGINAALRKIPQLSLGDVMGGNVINLTLVVGIATLIIKGVPAKSRLVQSSLVFTVAIVILPLLLILDGVLGKGDGLLLIMVFFFYIFWLFSKRERFSKIYKEELEKPTVKKFRFFIKDIGRILAGIIILLLASDGVVRSAVYFSDALNIPLVLVGILIIGTGNVLPELYFTSISAKEGRGWMILGGIMGCVVITSTLVLGIVAIIYPIHINDFTPFAIARFFLIISALFFFLFTKSDRSINRKEAIFLLAIYVLFVLSEIFFG